MQTRFKVLPDDHRVSVPPDPFSNSEVKRYIADGSVGLPHVRVGHRQALILRKAHPRGWAFFLLKKGDAWAYNTPVLQEPRPSVGFSGVVFTKYVRKRLAHRLAFIEL